MALSVTGGNVTAASAASCLPESEALPVSDTNSPCLDDLDSYERSICKVGNTSELYSHILDTALAGKSDLNQQTTLPELFPESCKAVELEQDLMFEQLPDRNYASLPFVPPSFVPLNFVSLNSDAPVAVQSLEPGQVPWESIRADNPALTEEYAGGLAASETLFPEGLLSLKNDFQELIISTSVFYRTENLTETRYQPVQAFVRPTDTFSEHQQPLSGYPGDLLVTRPETQVMGEGELLFSNEYGAQVSGRFSITPASTPANPLRMTGLSSLPSIRREGMTPIPGEQSVIWFGDQRQARFFISTNNLGGIDGQIFHHDQQVSLNLQSMNENADVLKAYREGFRQVVAESFSEPVRVEVAVSGQNQNQHSSLSAFGQKSYLGSAGYGSQLYAGMNSPDEQKQISLDWNGLRTLVDMFA